MGGGGRREQNLPESGEKTAETAECFSGIAAFQRKLLSMWKGIVSWKCGLGEKSY